MQKFCGKKNANIFGGKMRNLLRKKNGREITNNDIIKLLMMRTENSTSFLAQLTVAALVFADFFFAKIFFYKFRWKVCEIGFNEKIIFFPRKFTFAGNPKIGH